MPLSGRELGRLRLGKTALRVRYQAGQRLRLINRYGHEKDKSPSKGAFCLRAGYAVGLVFVVQIIGIRRKRTGIDELANLLNDDG